MVERAEDLPSVACPKCGLPMTPQAAEVVNWQGETLGFFAEGYDCEACRSIPQPDYGSIFDGPTESGTL